MTMQGYYVEHNGDCWQSVFPESEAHKSQLHRTRADAAVYMIDECGIDASKIILRPRRDHRDIRARRRSRMLARLAR